MGFSWSEIERSFWGRAIIWLAFAAGLGIAPLLFRSGIAMTILSQAGYVIIICLSYNILFGQGGMLSFGHAVYTGFGALIAMHAMRMAGDSGGWSVPLPLIPLVGGLAGGFMAVLFGYVTTKKSGITFAMITLGLGELVAAMSLMFPGFFGGEAGVKADRVYGEPLFGFDFGPQIQVYYLIAIYCVVCTALMYAFTCTPLGRLLNATRDNPERVEFIGYSTQRVRYLAFIVSGFFAGIGGGLAAINFEIINAGDSLSIAQSGSFLLFTFLGGASFFVGPIIGGIMLVLASVLLSDLTSAWLLYIGLFFVLMVMYVPGGVASLIATNVAVVHSGKASRLIVPYIGLIVASVAALCGLSLLIEMTYHTQFETAKGPVMRFLGATIDTHQSAIWIAAVLYTALVGAFLRFACLRFMSGWEKIQEEMDAAQAIEVRP
ncbi:MAG: branched-chain amino acid ABC transporter permease [Rhizobiales bacterium]|nr:branched-chain amino acid ABC transporter permease [Hyphomicrobiales bacterium]